jgi:hypothetical protein
MRPRTGGPLDTLGHVIDRDETYRSEVPFTNLTSLNRINSYLLRHKDCGPGFTTGYTEEVADRLDSQHR